MKILTKIRQISGLQSSYRMSKGWMDSNHGSFFKNRLFSIVWNSEKCKIFIYMINTNSQNSRSIHIIAIANSFFSHWIKFFSWIDRNPSWQYPSGKKISVIGLLLITNKKKKAIAIYKKNYKITLIILIVSVRSSIWSL